MNEKEGATPEAQSPRIWDEQAVSLLVEQMRFMMEHSVKNMKLEVIENMGAMLARRSGIDREIRELRALVDLLAKEVDGFGARLMRIEKGEPPIARVRGPIGRARDLTDGAHEPPQKVPVPPPQPEQKKKRGRPKGSGFYSRKRLAMEKGAQL